MCASGSPINKSQLARTLGIARSSLYVEPKRPKMDKALAVRIEELHEQDDTMGRRKLAVMLATGKNRVKRVMHTYGIAARRKRKKYVSPGKASQVAPNLLRMPEEVEGKEIVFSDILEVRVAASVGKAAGQDDSPSGRPSRPWGRACRGSAESPHAARRRRPFRWRP
jgi:putative transposase